MDLFHFGWRDSLSINKPEFWCISIRAPLAFIGPSNAISMASENHCTAPAAFREPSSAKEAEPGNGRPFRSEVFMANRGYRSDIHLWQLIHVNELATERHAEGRVLVPCPGKSAKAPLTGFPPAKGRQQTNGEVVNELFPRWCAAVVHLATDPMHLSPQK